MTDAMKFKEGTLESNNITTIRRDINNFDYTADTQSNIVIPLQLTCNYISLTAQEQLDLQNKTSVRTKFIDTLLWQDVEYISGMTTIKTIVPETVTSWVLTGYSLSATSGLGLLQTPLVLTTFKPFFTAVRMPCSCKLGDVAEVQVTIHNYVDQLSRVEVTLDDSAGDFEILPTGRGFSDYETYDEDYELRNLKQNTVQVVGDGVRSTTFSVKPKKIGPMRLKVQAISSVACDTVEKSIMVEPPGRTITRTVTRQIFLSPTQASTSIVFEINIPPNAVPGSKKVQFSIQGDKYSVKLINQQPLVTSDGDVLTSIVSQAANIFSSVSTLACRSPTAAADLLNAANNFLKGQCPDGGFRIDGDCDMPLRDTTYTARTLIATALSVKFGVADPRIVHKGFEWLASIQRADGSFPNPIPYPAVYVEGPITTAYVLFSFVDSDTRLPGIKAKHAATISKAFDNLFAQVDRLDILSLAYLGLAAYNIQEPRRRVAFDRLDRLSSKNEFTQRWPGSVWLDEAYPSIFYIYRYETDLSAMFRVANGMTQYLVENFDRMSASLAAKNSIISIVNDFIATWAATSFQMQMTFFSSNSSLIPSEKTTVIIDSSNQPLMSTFEMDANTKLINVMATGSGLATMEVTYEYNLMPEDVVDGYSLQLNLTSAMSKEWQLNVCASSKLNSTASVMEIKFPPGFNTSEYIQNHDTMTTKITVRILSSSRNL
jgi:CD109 antigen